MVITKDPNSNIIVPEVRIQKLLPQDLTNN